MDENKKTLGFIGVAAALLLGAWLLQPRPVKSETESLVNTKFFPEFVDPMKAASMEIVDFDPIAGPRVFKVSQVNDVWSIPSHQNYPADGKDHLAQAAASVIDLTRLDQVTDKASDHEMLGVLEPDGKLQPGSTGVGKRVTLEDKSGNKLAQFIIGNEVKDRPELRYVRVPGQDQVYMVSVKTDKLSTKFQNWIEEDLLKLNALDVKEIVIDDHSVDEVRGEIVLRGITTVDYDSKDSKWNLVDDKTFDPQTGKWSNVKLGEDQELNTTKLNELKTALDDLKIVDVVRKPPGLSADLRAGEELGKDAETKLALLRRGFFMAKTPENTFEIYSNEGEVRCGTADGVEYVLRFGGVAGSTQEDDKEKEPEKKADEAGADPKAASADAGVNRYIMVTTRFRPELIAKPDLQPLPEVPGGVDEAADEKADAEKEKTDAAKPDADKPAATGAPDKPAADKPATEAPAAPKESSRIDRRQGPQVQLVAYQPDAAKQPAAKAPAAKTQGKAPAAKGAPAPEAKAPEKAPAADEPADKPADTAPADDKAPAADAKPDAPLSADEAAAAADKARREALAAYKRISEENKRKQDEYDKKLASGKKRVDELNTRFADWYYVISDKTYEKIHIGRDQLLQKKGEPAHDANDGHDHGLPPGLPPGLIPPGAIPGAPKQ